jgi:peptidoglycan hydrolase-like protein with peptidoglycan-binding domain
MAFEYLKEPRPSSAGEAEDEQFLGSIFGGHGRFGRRHHRWGWRRRFQPPPQGQDDDGDGEQETEDFIRFWPHGFHHGFHGAGGFGRRWGWGRHWGRRWPFLGGVPTTSPLVPWAQSCLAQLFGQGVSQDGIMGPSTRQAIAQFQQQQQLPVTGRLDPNTVSALQAACSGQQPQGGAGPAAAAQPSGAGGQSEYDLNPRDARPCPKGGRFPGWSDRDLDVAKQQWANGVHDKNKVTDAVFWARHPDWNGKFLPGGTGSPEIENLKAEWKYLRCIVGRLVDIDEPLPMHELPPYEGHEPEGRQAGRWVRDRKSVV